MGVDLDPCNDIAPFQATWAQWTTLHLLCIDTRVNLRSWSNANDGTPVCAADADSWGTAIDAHVRVGDLIAVDVPDRTFFQGFRTRIRVVSAQLAHPVPAVGPTEELRWIYTLHLASEGVGVDPMERIGPATVAPGRMVVRDLTATELRWLREFAEFCAGSGGFAQR